MASLENKYFCNSSFQTENFITIGELCVNGSDTTLVECYKYVDEVTLGFKYLEGVWFLIVFLLGTFGNLATLVCISFSVKRKLLGFDGTLKSTTIFIMNLSLIDMIHCLVFTLPNSYSLLSQKWPFGSFWCKFCGYVSGWSWYSAMIAVNLIGISRYLDLKMNRKWVQWSHKGMNSMIVILCSWIPGIILINPKITTFTSIWMCDVGTCDFAPLDETWWWIFNAVAITSILMMCICYLNILSLAKQSEKTLQKLGNNGNILGARNAKMTRAILLLILMSTFCNLPMLICAILDVVQKTQHNSIMDDSPVMYHVMNIITESQFALNFLVYGLKHKKNRMAYAEFWKYLVTRSKPSHDDIETEMGIIRKIFCASKWKCFFKTITENTTEL